MNLAEELSKASTDQTRNKTKNAARILAAMQRFDDTEWLAPRIIQADRVRSTWADAASVREALEHLSAAGLIDFNLYIDPNNIGRPRYRLNAAGAAVDIHHTHIVREPRKPKVPEKTFEQLWNEANAKAPEGKSLILIDRWMVASSRKTPDEPPAF